MQKIIIFGLGQIAQVMYKYLKSSNDYDILGFTVNASYRNIEKLFDLPVVNFEEVDHFFPPSEFSMFIAMGYSNMNKNREEKYIEAKKMGYKFISYIHSSINIWDNVEIGENCFIFENNVIQPFAKIGNNVIIWSGNHIGHHSTIGDHCFISSHVVISGAVTIGNNSFIGVNSTIRDNISIGQNCIIGAGALILKNIKSYSVYIAEPTKKYPLRSDEINL